jgi:hypothetical protein
LIAGRDNVACAAAFGGQNSSSVNVSTRHHAGCRRSTVKRDFVSSLAVAMKRASSAKMNLSGPLRMNPTASPKRS